MGEGRSLGSDRKSVWLQLGPWLALAAAGVASPFIDPALGWRRGTAAAIVFAAAVVTALFAAARVSERRRWRGGRGRRSHLPETTGAGYGVAADSDTSTGFDFSDAGGGGDGGGGDGGGGGGD